MKIEKANDAHPLRMQEPSGDLAVKIVNDVLEERCASEEGARRYRPLLQERAHRIVARLIVEPNENGELGNDAAVHTQALLNLADATVNDELASQRYPRPACPDDGGCARCCTHMRIALSTQEAVVVARALRKLSSPEKAAIAQRLPTLGTSGPGSQCGLLNDRGLCTLYQARPINCRTYRSCSITACEDRIRFNRNAGEEVVFTYPFDDLVRKSFHHVVQQGGSPQPLEMNAFLAFALRDDQTLSAGVSSEIQVKDHT